MKPLPFLLSAFLLICLTSTAQIAVRELPDPHPSDARAWEGVRNLRFGWGNIDTRYKKDELPVLAGNIALYGWRGERVCAQAVLSAPKAVRSFRVRAGSLKSGKNMIPSSAVTPYFETYVMGEVEFQGDSVLCADRLVVAGERDMAVEDRTVRPVWVNINIPKDAAPGKYKGTLLADCDGVSFSIPYVLEVGRHTLPQPQEWSFHLDLWQNPFAAARYFGVPLWSQEHFDRMRPIMEYLASAGQKVITTSIFQHPWNGQTQDPFESMIGKFRGIDGSWKYDYTVFDRWVEFMMDCGITEQIDCYTVLPWHLTFEYYDGADNCTHVKEMTPGTKEYEDYLLPFLTDFAAHLKSKGWFGKTCIAMDERPKDLLEHAYDIVHRAEPRFRIKGAINYFGPEVAERMYDISFAFREPPLTSAQLESHLSKGNRVTFYTCCSPMHPNTFIDSNPAESAVMGWHAAALGYNGYLRWAYNSWVTDPCTDARFRTWKAGDCFLVYPDGPSIRMERLIEGIQAYEKIRILRKEITPGKAALLDAQLKKFLDFNWSEFTDAQACALVNESRALLRTLEK